MTSAEARIQSKPEHIFGSENQILQGTHSKDLCQSKILFTGAYSEGLCDTQCGEKFATCGSFLAKVKTRSKVLCPGKRVPTRTRAFLSLSPTRTQIKCVLAGCSVKEFVKVKSFAGKARNSDTFPAPGHACARAIVSDTEP